MRFADRRDAGQQLAAKLADISGDAVVYALPRGGVVLGVEIAIALGAPLTLAISRKVAHPNAPEFAVCAVTETGPLICNEIERSSLDPEWLKQAEAEQRAEAKRRRETYLADRQPVSAKGKTAIIVDDGVATGLTLKAAIAEVKKQEPARTIVAVPVAPRDVAEELRAEVDELVALTIPVVYLGAVGAYYDFFPQVEDSEVIEQLSEVST